MLGNALDCKHNVDLLIRTGGDHRLSNFLLWQAAYAELFFTDTLWPDFTTNELEKIEHLLMESEEEVHLLNEKEIELQQLEKGINTLNEEQKRCVELFYIQEKSYAEVVETTGYELKKVKSYIQNGKRNLKLYLINNKTEIILIVLLHIL